MCSVSAVALTMTTVSTVAQGFAAKKQGEYQNSVAQYNARVQENEATQIRNKGVEEENIQREETAQLLSKQRAQFGAANVDLTSGSPLEIQESTEILGEADALRIRSNFQREAESLEQQADLTRAEGAAAEEAGGSAFTSSLLSAGGALLAGGVADKWFTPASAANVPSASGGLSISGGAKLKPLTVG